MYPFTTANITTANRYSKYLVSHTTKPSSANLLWIHSSSIVRINWLWLSEPPVLYHPLMTHTNFNHHTTTSSQKRNHKQIENRNFPLASFTNQMRRLVDTPLPSLHNKTIQPLCGYDWPPRINILLTVGSRNQKKIPFAPSSPVSLWFCLSHF